MTQTDRTAGRRSIVAPDAIQALTANLPDSEVFRLIAESIPALVAVLKPNWEVESLNSECLGYFGMTLEQLKDWQFAGVVHPDDLPAVIEAVTRSTRSEEPYEIEHRSRRADGVFRWFHVRALPLRDREGRLLRWLCLQEDIDDRKRTELLSNGEKRVLEMIAAALPVADVLNALCTLLDDAAEGCSSHALVVDRTRTRVERVFGPGLPASYLAALDGIAVDSRVGPCGLALSLKAPVVVFDAASETRFDPGSWPALALAHGLKSCWSWPILSPAGEGVGTFALYPRTLGVPSPFHQKLVPKLAHIASIAVERAHSEEALRRTEAFLTEAQRLSATGSFSLNYTTGARWWSPETYRIFGADPAQSPSFELMRERVHPDDRELLERALAAARNGVAFSAGMRLRMPNGTIKHLQIVAHDMGTAGGKHSEFVGAVQDVTERRLAEEALGRAQAELAHVARVTTLGTLAASIAHEVNNPLSGVITNATTCARQLAAEPTDLDGARQTVKRVLRDGRRAADVITRLRSLFANKAPVMETMDLNEAMREVLALTRSELQRNRVLLRVDLAERLAPIKGDRIQLQQVVLNLLLNATEAMADVEDRPKELRLETARDEEDYVRLSVRDAGHGIEGADAARLFDPFFTTKKGGMGMGLSVSRSIVEGHGGRLWAVPNADGPGATFRCVLPIAGD